MIGHGLSGAFGVPQIPLRESLTGPRKSVLHTMLGIRYPPWPGNSEVRTGIGPVCSAYDVCWLRIESKAMAPPILQELFLDVLSLDNKC